MSSEVEAARESAVGAGPEETALGEAMAWLAEAASAAPRLDREALWRRVEARVSPELRGQRSEHAGAARRLALRLRWSVLAAAAACLLGLAIGSRLSPPRWPAERLRPVRLDLSLWDRGLLAREPLSDGIDELNALLEGGPAQRSSRPRGRGDGERRAEVDD